MQEFCISIIDVGHGNSAVLCSQDRTVVFDGGKGSALLEFLQAEKIRKIDAILVSHADEDHIGGLMAVVACGEFEIGKVRMNSDASKNTKLWNQFLGMLNILSLNGIIDGAVSLTNSGTDDLQLGSIDIKILAPNLYIAGKTAGSVDTKGRVITSNSASAVFQILVDSKPLVLLPGDVDQNGLELLVEDNKEKEADLQTPIVIFPHHGGKPEKGDPIKFATRLCQVILPELVIFSIGRDRYELPREEVISAITKCNPKMRIMCTQLSKQCAEKDLKVTPTHLTQKFSQGRQNNRCCAGTITILRKEGDVEVLPKENAHDKFLRAVIPNALCMNARHKK